MRRASRLARWAVVLLVGSCFASSIVIEGAKGPLEQRLNDLEAEVQALRQQLHGAAVLQQDLAAAGEKHAAACETLSAPIPIYSTSAGQHLLARFMFSAHDIAPREVPHCCSSSNLMLDSSVHTMRPDRLVELDIIFLLCTAGMRSFVPPTGNLQRTLATRMPLWPQHWSFSSAVSADSKLTVSHVTTDRPNSGSGMFVVLGDAGGRLYFFTAAGHLLFEHDTGNDKGQCLPYTGFRVAYKQSVDGNLQHICSIRRCWWGLQELWHNSTNSSWQLQPDMQQSLAGLLMNRMRTSSTAAAACRWWWRSNSDLFGPAAQQHHTAGCGAAAGHGAAAGSDS